MAHKFTVLVAVLAVAATAMAAGSGDAAVDEINAIPIERIISAPLMAVVNAQAAAARTSMQFIFETGFAADSNGQKAPKMVKFDYNSVTSAGGRVKGSMNVPILSMIPIPFLRFESIDVEFNVKITESKDDDSSTTSSASSTFKDEDAALKNRAPQVTQSATVSHKSTNKNSQETREYSTRVLVHASQAEIPEGMGKILDKLLELAISMPKASS